MPVHGIGPSRPAGAGGPEPQGYVTRQGDRLGEIAKRFGVSPEAMQKANPGVSADKPLPAGERLTLPHRGSAEPKPASEERSGLAGYQPDARAGDAAGREAISGPRRQVEKAVMKYESEPMLEPGKAAIWGSPEAKVSPGDASLHKVAPDPTLEQPLGYKRTPDPTLEQPLGYKRSPDPTLEQPLGYKRTPDPTIGEARAAPGPASELRLTPDQFGFDEQGNLVIRNEEIRDLFRALMERAQEDPGTASWKIRIE